MKKQENQSTQPDESGGEKVSGKPTLVRKGIRTFYGIVEDSLENKKENYDWSSSIIRTDGKNKILS